MVVAVTKLLPVLGFGIWFLVAYLIQVDGSCGECLLGQVSLGVAIVELVVVYIDQHNYDVPCMYVAGLQLQRQQTEHGSLWMVV
jgi:hypothetical protein